jgi:two-component system OmpR family sensor kinase
MSLRQKLLTIFGALALISLVIAGVTFWTITQWRASNEDLEGHFRRSLLVQRVRAAMFHAFKEVPDAVTGDDPSSRREFDEYIRPAEEDFAKWSELANTDEEREEVRRVREKYDVLVRGAQHTFDLVEAGRMREAFDFMEGQLEDHDFKPFQEVTEQAVASDQRKREDIRVRVQGTRRNAQIILSIAAFGALSVILLLAAYLASDLFKPLREVEAALAGASSGDTGRRLDEERGDEIGAINKAFNRMVAAVALREQAAGSRALDGDASPDDDSAWATTTSRLTLHALVAQLRARALRLRGGNADGAKDSAEATRALVEEIDQLTQAVSRVTEFGFPLDVNLARTDMRALLYEVILRFHEEFAERTVSFEFDLGPEVDYAMVDRLKLRVAIGELVRNALKALPEKGGRLGVRARLAKEKSELVIEVADSGKGTDEPPADRAFAGDQAQGKRAPLGLRLTKAIVEQHGGSLKVNGASGEGSHVQIKLPLRK